MNLPNPEPVPEGWVPGVLLSHYETLNLWDTFREPSIKLSCYLSVTESFTIGGLRVPKNPTVGRIWVRKPTEQEALLCSLDWFLVNQAVLMFDGYEEGISSSVFLLVALAMVLNLDDDGPQFPNFGIHKQGSQERIIGPGLPLIAYQDCEDSARS